MKEYLKMYLKFAVPMMIPVIFALITSYVDKVMLGYYWTSEVVGYYFSVQRISTMIMMIPAAIGIVLFPTISSLHIKYRQNRDKRNREIAILAKKSVRFTSMVTMPIVCVFVVFSIPVIDIVLNSSFRPGSSSMQILAIYTFVASILIPYHFVVLGMNRPGLTAKIFAASGLMNITLNLLLIPRNGMLAGIGINGPAGAATATLVSSLVMFAGMFYYAGKLTKKRMMQNRIFLHIFAGIPASLLMMWLAEFADPIRWFHMVPLTLAGLGAYLGVLCALGEFRKPELRFFLETVNPLLLFRHVKDEVRDKSQQQK